MIVDKRVRERLRADWPPPQDGVGATESDKIELIGHELRETATFIRRNRHLAIPLRQPQRPRIACVIARLNDHGRTAFRMKVAQPFGSLSFGNFFETFCSDAEAI